MTVLSKALAIKFWLQIKHLLRRSNYFCICIKTSLIERGFQGNVEVWQSRLFGPEGPVRYVKSNAAWLYMHLLPRVSTERRLVVLAPLFPICALG